MKQLRWSEESNRGAIGAQAAARFTTVLLLVLQSIWLAAVMVSSSHVNAQRTLSIAAVEQKSAANQQQCTYPLASLYTGTQGRLPAAAVARGGAESASSASAAAGDMTSANFIRLRRSGTRPDFTRCRPSAVVLPHKAATHGHP